MDSGKSRVTGFRHTATRAHTHPTSQPPPPLGHWIRAPAPQSSFFYRHSTHTHTLPQPAWAVQTTHTHTFTLTLSSICGVTLGQQGQEASPDSPISGNSHPGTPQPRPWVPWPAPSFPRGCLGPPPPLPPASLSFPVPLSLLLDLCLPFSSPHFQGLFRRQFLLPPSPSFFSDLSLSYSPNLLWRASLPGLLS